MNCQHCKPYSLPSDRARIAELEALVSSMRENGRRVTFSVETYINGVRFSTGDYQIMRIGPPTDENPPL